MARAQTAKELSELLSTITVLYHKRWKNADGTPQRWKINGMIKLYKNNEQKIYIPLKRGLRCFGSISSVDDFYEEFDI